MAPQQFTLFPRLPGEIQFLIWEQALSFVLPRVVEIKPVYGLGDLPKSAEDPKLPFVSVTPCHPLLHACHDSRNRMLRKWPLRFGHVDGGHKACIPFNSDMDTLFISNVYMDPKCFVFQFDEEDRQAIKKVAFHPGDLEFIVLYSRTKAFQNLLKLLLPNLRGIYFPIYNNLCRRELALHDWSISSKRPVIPYTLDLEIVNDLDDFTDEKIVEDANLMNFVRIVTRGGLWARHVRVHQAFGWAFPNRPKGQLDIKVIKPRYQFIGLDVDLWGYPMETTPLKEEALSQFFQHMDRSKTLRNSWIRGVLKEGSDKVFKQEIKSLNRIRSAIKALEGSGNKKILEYHQRLQDKRESRIGKKRNVRIWG